ncbi:Gfo/Idh/MocA family oxidoreductase [Candidatus Woesearchaeota archaeon]|nr:Gfo/Idh/MocA family oxidoreductase [Candidatus Woesearchaeota archaeon]
MKPLRFGLLGLGYFGRNYLRLLQDVKDARLEAVAAKTRETLEQYRSATPKEAIKTTNASEIIKNPEIDCVVIATPAATHFKLAKEALENGKHVLLEKPMVASLDEAKKLRALAEKSPSTFMVGHQYIYNDYVRYLHNSIAELGKISHAIAEHIYNGPVRDDTGCLWDAGTHQLAMVQYLFSPGKIISAAGRSVCMRNKGIDDFTAVAAKFENGLAATIIVTWLSPKKTRKLTVIGSKKNAVFDDIEEKGKLVFIDRKNGKKTAPKIAAKEPLRNQVEHFIRCINTGQKPLTGIDSSYEIIEWLDKISRSVK